MHSKPNKDHLLGALWGAVVGDALGVPVEFLDRSELRRKPVTDMRGFGTHNQPAGTWSDDSALMLCSVESLLSGFNTEDMGKRFVAWYRNKLWTPHGEVFDIGGATRQALSRIESGIPAEKAGGTDLHSNGNGSLMRILPVPLLFHAAPKEELLDKNHRASAITHGHPRSLLACGYFSLFVTNLLQDHPPQSAYEHTTSEFKALYSATPDATSLPHFELLTSGKLAEQPEDAISSSGYVIDTLTASIWCLLTSTNYTQAVLKAVNLGSDTDTTATVTGGLAGLFYGLDAVPDKWRAMLARRKELEDIFASFTKLIGQT